MLIEFSVANFYSIKERQTLSMVASKGAELEETHTFAASISGGRSEIRLLRSAAVYGANAAGKTYLVHAMSTMCDMVSKSALEQARGIPLPVMPFMLDPKSREKSSKLEMHFIIDGVRYQYGFTATREQVLDEWMVAYPRGRAQNWFSRAWESKAQSHGWEFGVSFSGEKKLWQKSTRDNALFLSTAVQLNSQQLQPVYDWFTGNAPVISMMAPPAFASNVPFPENSIEEKVLNALKIADPGIDDIRIVEKKGGTSQLPGYTPEETGQAARKDHGSSFELKTFHLDTEGNRVAFSLSHDGSRGTRKTFSVSHVLFKRLEKGAAVFVDELSDELHVELSKFMVNLFHSNRTNPHNAQLIFTTHETSLLNQEFLRRDQIWFCEKNDDNATVLYPLTDFHPRKGRENLELGYLSGAYGAVPYIRES